MAKPTNNLTELISNISITSGDLRLDAVSPATIGQLAEVAMNDIHGEDYMPFGTPWSAGSKFERRDRLQRWYLDRLSESNQLRWSMIFSVRKDGKIVGSTNLFAENFSQTRSVSTGSWLTMEAQGGGVGTKMRQMLLELSFLHLGAEEATSEAWGDNVPSRRVNEKCGYSEIQKYEKKRNGTLNWMIQYCVKRKDWVQKSQSIQECQIFIPAALRKKLIS